VTGSRSTLRAWVGGAEVAVPDAWRLEWMDRAIGLARLSKDGRSETVLVEGQGTDWWVTLLGRRVRVTVRTWREQVLAHAETSGLVGGGTLEVKATLPGMIVAVHAAEGSDTNEGDPLITIEAMKMQNEVRAPRSGRIAAVAVAPGETVTTGQLLVRLE
jgi:acetyl/propionyl-CoA carboxylase alpha subunit